MSESVFEKLLGSYSGMRKRTWAPSIIKEAALSDEQQKAQPAIQAAFTQAVGGTPVMGQGTRQNINFEPVQDQPGRVKISGSNIPAKILDQTGFNNTFGRLKSSYHPASFAYKVFAAWAPQEEEEKEGDEKSKKTVETEAPQQTLGFSKTQRDGMAEYVEQKNGLDPTEAQSFVQKLQKTILTPLSRTKLGKLFTGRPDLTPVIQQQMLDLTSRFFSMAGKVETVTLADGSQVKAIRSDKLSAGDRKATKTITVRGTDGGKGVYFGRADGEYVDEYKELQEYARSYDHKTYGLGLGASMNKYGTALFDTRIIPEGVDPSTMTKEDFDKLDLAAQKSTATGTGSGQNDTNGKLAEDMIQLTGALMTGNKEQRKEAVQELKKRLEKVGSIGGADMENLESALLSGEVDDLKSFLQGSESLEAGVRRQLETLARKTEKMKEVLGITAVVASRRPSAESKLGDRADNEYVIDDKNPLSKDFKDAMNDNDDGTYSVEISAKEYDNPLTETVLGSNSIHNAYGKGATQDYDKLHEEHMQRAITAGHLTQDQVQATTQALETDRETLNTLEGTLGSLTKPNKTALKSQINSLIKDAGNQGFTTIAAQQAYVKELKSLKDTLSTEKNPRKAAVKLFQLSRIVRAENNPQYAAGAFINDSILSMGSFKNEVIMRGSPTDVAFAQTHDVLGRMAQDAFSGEMTIVMGVSGNSMKDSEGNNLARNRVAGKEAKQFAEGRIPSAGKDRYMTSHSI